MQTITANQIVLASGDEKLSDRLVTINSNQIQLQNNISATDSKVTNIEAGQITLQNKVNGIEPKVTKITSSGVYTGEIVADQVDFDGAKGNNVELSGKITATSGKIGGYNISGNNLVGNDVTLGENAITIGDGIIKSGLVGTGRSLGLDTGILNIGAFDESKVSWLYLNKKLFVNKGGNGFYIAGPDFRVNGLFITTGAIDEASDERLKSDIKNIPKDLIKHISREVKPKQFIIDGKIHFGYIAQDVQKALNSYDNADNYKVLGNDGEYLSLVYNQLAVLKEAEMQNRIDTLKERLESLEKQIRGDK